MIKDSNTRVTFTTSKDTERKLKEYCEKNGITKSAAIGIALGVLFGTGMTIGDIIGEKLKGDKQNE